MILPIKFLWEQLNGPQITGFCKAVFDYWSNMFDKKLDYINNISVDTANDRHLTLLGIIANFVRPIIALPDKDYFLFTEFKEESNDHGFTTIEDRKHGGRLVDLEVGPGQMPHPLETEYYRTLLKSYIDGEGELGSLELLDDICYALSKLEQPSKDPAYTFSWIQPEGADKDKSPGDIYIDIGSMNDWPNPMQIYAVLMGLANSTYAPVPRIRVSLEQEVYVPPPTCELPSGTYEGPQTLKMNCIMYGAAIYYTTDGSTPDMGESPTSKYYNKYDPPIITESCTVKMKAFNPPYEDSEVSTYEYVIT